MAFPAAIPYVIAAVTAVGAIQQAQAAKKAANYNAQLADENAKIARQQGDSHAAQIRRQSVLGLGDMRASFAANGVSLEGSALDVMADSAYQYELDKQNARYNAELKARGYSNEAQLQRARGESAMTAGYLKAGSSLIGAAGNAYQGSSLQTAVNNSSNYGGSVGGWMNYDYIDSSSVV